MNQMSKLFLETFDSRTLKRESNFELLRIVAIILIIAFHFSDHASLIPTSEMPLNLDWMVMAFARVGGGTGNGVFVLLTGYFLSVSKFKVLNIFRLWLEVVFYCILCYILSRLVYDSNWEFSWDTFVHLFMPLTSNRYWFMSTYLLLFLFSPYLNLIVRSINRKQYLYLIITGTLCFSIWPTFFDTARWLVSNNAIPVFFLLYLIGAYIRKYSFSIHSNNSIQLLITVMFFILLCLSTIILKHLRLDYTYFLWTMEKTPIMLFSISLFIFMKDIRIGCVPFINVIASTVFGCYLLHMGEFWPFFFRTTFDVGSYYGSNFVFLQMLLAIIFIFCLSIIVDILRQKFFERPIIERVRESMFIKALQRRVDLIFS